jgi:DNA repair protein RadD
MIMKLRPYQSQAHDAAIYWIKKCTDPCVLELPTGSGKSLIVAEIANTLHKVSGGKHILCLVPSKELLEQNAEKYRDTDNECSLFSASVGETCLKHPVVFGTPVSVKNKIHRFGAKFCAVVLDEAHRITPTVKSIIESLMLHNPNLRVIGLSATPYRLGDGYIYRMDEHCNAHGEDKAKKPYFNARVFTVYARDLIQQGYLTQPIIGGINSGHYETLDMELNSMGKFAKADVDKAYHGRGRLTSSIVGDIVSQAVDRQGIMIFAATVQHAHEVLESLPPGLSCIVTGKTPKKEREQILQKFKSRQLKYLVNVSVLTTGFDAPHVDLIAILRATESVSLLQQIIGRGLRIDDNKNDCLILDYAENIDRHCPDGDIFNPEIEASTDYVAGEAIKAQCPECKAHNEFAPVINEAKHEIDINGYFIDLEGIRLETEFGEMSAHHGRRCYGEVFNKTIKKLVRCSYRWTFKPCVHCEAENDIAARYCCECKHELIDPNSKLISDFQMKKKDPTQIQTDKVVAMRATPTLSKAGNECLRVDFVTEYRSFPVWFTMKMQKHYDAFMAFTDGGFTTPNTITYKKSGDFFKIYDYNRNADEVPQ